MATLSTHVLDTALGRPAAGIRVALETSEGAHIDAGTTDDDGRVGSLGGRLVPGAYVLRFATGGYLGAEASTRRSSWASGSAPTTTTTCRCC